MNYLKCLTHLWGLAWLGLDEKEVDTFLIEKIYKKLKFWNMIHLLIAGRAIIVNFVLASTLLFLVSVLGGGGAQ